MHTIGKRKIISKNIGLYNSRRRTLNGMPRRKCREWWFWPELHPERIDVCLYITRRSFVVISEFCLPALNKSVGNGQAGPGIGLGSGDDIRVCFLNRDCSDVI